MIDRERPSIDSRRGLVALRPESSCFFSLLLRTLTRRSCRGFLIAARRRKKQAQKKGEERRSKERAAKKKHREFFFNRFFSSSSTFTFLTLFLLHFAPLPPILFNQPTPTGRHEVPLHRLGRPPLPLHRLQVPAGQPRQRRADALLCVARHGRARGRGAAVCRGRFLRGCQGEVVLARQGAQDPLRARCESSKSGVFLVFLERESRRRRRRRREERETEKAHRRKKKLSLSFPPHFLSLRSPPTSP